MDLTGLISPKTAEYLSKLTLDFATPITSRLLISIRAESTSPDKIYATFTQRGSSGQVQINSKTKQESTYYRILQIEAVGEFFPNEVLPAFTLDSIEALWGKLPLNG